ncbi:putative adhesin [Fuerstiella marisgermanici]|uniref:Putative adhesin Stv domain-containing protein n=1 Tax=Fuerstiella marisgermanici TaxID=1891926 RepID=A0A1P8WMI9_9PLAN|nr:hypothetical protein [Fuerstiella marisgermanici]APZ95270.1 hypothetical protein Fuma_04926 [Fuerstiella marisgermanici]
MSWGKSDQDRIQHTLDYIKRVSATNHQLLIDYVNGNSVFSAATISKALSLKLSRFGRGGTTQSQRHAIRGCILTRLAAESPASTAVATAWKNTYKTQTEDALKMQIARYLGQLRGATALPKSKPKSPSGPAAYGLSAESLQAIKGGLSAPKAVSSSTSATDAGPPPAPTAALAAKKTYFEKLSRSNIVLSGHGSWPAPFRKVRLKPQQKLCCYCRQFYPLGNDVGQLIDSRQFPVPEEEFPGGSEVCDYMLHNKDTLKLLNHSVGDAKFITVTTDTPISTFINNPAYVDATFHFAACRVVSKGNKLGCPVHRVWEPYVQGQPLPCVLR